MSIKIPTPVGIAPKAAAARPARRPGPHFRQPARPARQFARQPARPAASSGQPAQQVPQGRRERPVSGFRASPDQRGPQGLPALLALLAQVQPAQPGLRGQQAPPVQQALLALLGLPVQPPRSPDQRAQPEHLY